MASLEKFDEFVETLSELDDETRFEYILDLARKHRHDPFPASDMTPKNEMHGCQAKVWIVHERKGDRHYFRGHSDAAIVNGLVTMMTDSFSGLTGREIAELSIDHVRKLNLGSLTMQRQVGMMAMLKHIKKLGLAEAA
jgi:cysteine desulfuration protein SufE